MNEAEFAERAIASCSLGSKPTETITRVARYHRSGGYSRQDTERLLEMFMLKCDPNINIVKWQDTISKCIKAAEKYDLICIDGIPVTKAEIDICNSLDGCQSKRLMFTLICLAKYSNAINSKNNNWINRPDKEVFSLANIVTPIKRQSLMLNDLMTGGLIKFSRRVDNLNVSVRCVDLIGDPVLMITDFRNLGYQYEKFCGGKFIECEACGLVIKQNGNRQKYCQDCYLDLNRQNALSRYKAFIS